MKKIRNDDLIVNLDKIEYCRADLIERDTFINNFGTQFVNPYRKIWHNLYFTDKTAKFSQTSTRKNSGVIRKQKVVCVKTGFDGVDTHEVNDSFHYTTKDAIYYPLILRVTTCDGEILLMGRAQSPTRFKESNQLNAKETNSKFTFERISTDRISIEDLGAQ